MLHCNMPAVGHVASPTGSHAAAASGGQRRPAAAAAVGHRGSWPPDRIRVFSCGIVGAGFLRGQLCGQWRGQRCGLGFAVLTPGVGVVGHAHAPHPLYSTNSCIYNHF